MNNRTIGTIFIFFVIILSLCCVCSLAGGGSWFYYELSQDPEFQVAWEELTATATPTPAPEIIREPFVTPGDQPTTASLLLETEIPIRDLPQLASRLKHNGQDIPLVVNATPPIIVLGDSRSFWISDDTSGTPRQFEVQATLQHVTNHTYWWVEEGYSVSATDLERSAEVFETQTYPITRDFFGSEWRPGVDNDEHIHIFLGNVPGVGGYYASLNEFSQAVNPYSNEGEMFFINLDALTPGTDYFDGVLAHEFQHMIHWYQDRNEATWVNEGLSELASHLNGYSPGGAYEHYLSEPDLQLTTWAHESGATIPHYGGSYLFMRYFLDQFGEDVLKMVVTTPANGIQGFNDVLTANDIPLTFNDVFANFAVANYLNDTTLAEGQWGYTTFSPLSPKLATTHTTFPVAIKTTVHQYGVDYIHLDTNTNFTLAFTGSTTIKVVNNQAYSGNYQWYSNRADGSNTHLTRAFDLQNVSQATLTYKTWFDIEEDWDYAYLEVSTDQGQSWAILAPAHSRDTNPSGNAYGPGYTGKSGEWLTETVDLSTYAGEEILLRFEYITDDAVNGAGFTLDDVAIPEIGFFDDMETPDPAWLNEGFIRMDNHLQQQFIVYLIAEGETNQIIGLPLDETNLGNLVVDTAPNTTYILVVTAQAPVTTEVASYAYSITTP